jgi:hypothetical protein
MVSADHGQNFQANQSNRNFFIFIFPSKLICFVLFFGLKIFCFFFCSQALVHQQFDLQATNYDHTLVLNGTTSTASTASSTESLRLKVQAKRQEMAAKLIRLELQMSDMHQRAQKLETIPAGPQTAPAQFCLPQINVFGGAGRLKQVATMDDIVRMTYLGTAKDLVWTLAQESPRM